MWWTIHLEGGPRRVNHAAVAIGQLVYSFGGYCSGDNYDAKNDIDVFMLDTLTYRWHQLSSPESSKKPISNELSAQEQYRLFRQRYNMEEESSDEELSDENDENNEHYLTTVSRVSKKATPFQRYGHTVVAYNGKAYLFGGRSDDHGANSLLHEYDPATLQWKTVEAKGQIPPARDGHTAVVHQDKMYIFGGFEYNHRHYSNSVYAFNFKTSTWETIVARGEIPSHRDFHASAIVKDKMYIFGGRGDVDDSYVATADTYCDKLYAFDLKTYAWEELATSGDVPQGRRSHSMWEHRGKLYLFGGYESVTDIHFNDFYSFDTEAKVWTKLRPNGQKPSPRRRQCSVIVGDKVFIFGGTMPNRMRRQGALCDLADMHVLDYSVSLKTIAAKKLIDMKIPLRALPPLGLCLHRDLYNMSRPNTITSISPKEPPPSPL